MATSVPGESTFSDISGLLKPRSIAVVGASDRPGNFGGETVRRLLKFGYPGQVWPVNPNSTTVAGLPCYPSPGALPGAADLAVFAMGANALADSIAECADVGIRNGIAYAGGFAEAGGEGVALQHALKEVCQRFDFKLCGPNCAGIINAHMPATATFATALVEMDRLIPGGISIVGQSGGMSTLTLSHIHRAGFGFRYLISSGNEAVLNFSDYLHALALDEDTRIILGYLEGVTDGRKFLAALAGAREREKPVILIKTGATEASASAAQAHTGALAGTDRVYDSIFREMGVMRVYSVEEMVDVALLASATEYRKLPKSPGVGVVTFGGGNGVLGADQCAQNGLSTPRLSDQGVQQLKGLVTSVASAANPMDLTPLTAMRAEWLEKLPSALDVIAAEPQLDSVLCMCSSLASRAAEITEIFTDFWRRSPKAVCISWLDPPSGVPEKLAEAGIYNFSEQARAARALGHLVRHRENLARPRRTDQIEPLAFDWSAFVMDSSPGKVVPEHTCHAVLAAAKLPVAAGRLARREDEAVAIAEEIVLPVALKGVSSAITHRAAAGLLAIDLRSPEEVRSAFRRLTARAEALDARLDGIYVQHMVDGGTELLVSAFRDPLFGTIVTCGAGGNLTEVLDDVAMERGPIDEDLALDMIGRLRVAERARRHGKDEALRNAAGFVAAFSRLVESAPWRQFTFEVNPIKCSEESAVAVDGLLIIEKA